MEEPWACAPLIEDGHSHRVVHRHAASVPAANSVRDIAKKVAVLAHAVEHSPTPIGREADIAAGTVIMVAPLVRGPSDD